MHQAAEVDKVLFILRQAHPTRNITGVDGNRG
jgi:hypothetical protein